MNSVQFRGVPQQPQQAAAPQRQVAQQQTAPVTFQASASKTTTAQPQVQFGGLKNWISSKFSKAGNDLDIAAAKNKEAQRQKRKENIHLIAPEAIQAQLEKRTEAFLKADELFAEIEYEFKSSQQELEKLKSDLSKVLKEYNTGLKRAMEEKQNGDAEVAEVMFLELKEPKAKKEELEQLIAEMTNLVNQNGNDYYNAKKDIEEHEQDLKDFERRAKKSLRDAERYEGLRQRAEQKRARNSALKGLLESQDEEMKIMTELEAEVGKMEAMLNRDQAGLSLEQRAKVEEMRRQKEQDSVFDEFAEDLAALEEEAAKEEKAIAIGDQSGGSTSQPSAPADKPSSGGGGFGENIED